MSLTISKTFTPPVIALVLTFFSGISPLFAQSDEDKKLLLMYFTEEELVVQSATRSPKSVSQTAENVSVITAKEIELMNAHTVADALNMVAGIQVFMTSGPGSQSLAFIQGSDHRHVSVFIDGIPLNNISDNVTDLGMFGVQNIEKIEIIKGPASSAWGSALGGVINIITKAVPAGPGIQGTLVGSIGERETADLRVETSGRQGGFGYHFNVGRLHTDGLRPHFQATNENTYAKLSYDITEKTRMQVTANYGQGSRGNGAVPAADLSFSDDFWFLRSSFLLRTEINKNTDASFSLWSSRQKADFITSLYYEKIPLAKDHWADQGNGANAELRWKNQTNNIVFGTDVESKELESNTIAGNEQTLRKAGFYLNDTLSFSRVSVTPGIRHDDTSSNKDFTSPSLGVTYTVADTTILRAYAAKGFGIPTLGMRYGDNISVIANRDLKMERVLSCQSGVETALKYVWTKVSVFRHEIRDVISTEPAPGFMFKAINKGKQRRQGVEAEIKTAPLYGTSLTAGAEYIAARDLDTGLILKNIPRHIYDLGLLYENQHSFNAQLKGRYIDWNADPDYGASDNSFIFDLNIMQVLFRNDENSLETFLTVHNLFNNSQYPLFLYQNPDRWTEAGMRYKF